MPEEPPAQPQYGSEELVVEEPEPLLDWDRLAEADIDVVDVTPSNFGRIAAQTAKQVIIQSSARPRSGPSTPNSKPRRRARPGHRPAQEGGARSSLGHGEASSPAASGSGQKYPR